MANREAAQVTRVTTARSPLNPAHAGTFPVLWRWRLVRIALGCLSVSLVGLALSVSPARAAATLQYDHGDPSNQEQYMLELVNRARANPSAEGAFLLSTGDASVGSALSQFQVDTGQLVADFNSYAARPPVAFNAALSVAANRHGLDLIAADIQDHTGSDGSTPGSRVTDAGYAFSFVRENVYSYAQSPLYAHAAFNIDWGPNESTGVQNWPLPGHRQAIMNFRPLGSPSTNSTAEPLLTEVGMSWLAAPNRPTVGPNVVVQDFATAAERFLLGVVYDDLDNDGFYTPGEGLPGVTVTPDGGDWFAVTSSSGGYAIPVAALGVRTVALTASGGGIGSVAPRTVSLTGDNTKVDFLIDVSAVEATTTTATPTTTTATPTTIITTTVPAETTTTVAPTSTTEPTSVSIVVAEATTTTQASVPPTTLAEIQVLQVQAISTTTTVSPPTTFAVTTTVAPSTTVGSTSPPNTTTALPPTTVESVPGSTATTTETIVTVESVPTTDATAATVLGVSTDQNDANADASIGSTSTIGIDLAANQTLPITGPQTATQMTLVGLAVLAAGLNLLVGSRQPA